MSMISQFTDSNALSYQGTPTKRADLRGIANQFRYIISSYGLALQEQDIAFFRKLSKGSILILDEAHKIKSRNSRRSKALKGLSPFCTYKFALTATPVYNRLDDLFSIMQFVDESCLGSWREFSDKYLIMSYNRVVGQKNSLQLHKELEPKIIRRSRESVKDQLPDVTRRVVLINPTGSHAVLLKRLRTRIVEELQKLVDAKEWSWNGSIKHPGVLKYMTMLDQAGIVPTLADKFVEPFFIDTGLKCEDTKLVEAVSLAKDIVNNGDSVITFCRYLNGIYRLQEMFDKSFILTGKMSKQKQEESISHFKRAAKNGAILLSSEVGGESLNLPEARYVINIDIPWGAADLEQRNSRNRRINSEFDNLFTYQFLIPGLDEYKWFICNWKASGAESVIDGIERVVPKPKLKNYLTSDTFNRETICASQHQ